MQRALRPLNRSRSCAHDRSDARRAVAIPFMTGIDLLSIALLFQFPAEAVRLFLPDASNRASADNLHSRLF
jgi:hypothetical protein